MRAGTAAAKHYYTGEISGESKVNIVKVLDTVSEVRVMSEHVSFTTTINDIIDENSLSVVAPVKKEQQAAIKQGEKLRLTCITERGLYMFDAKITDIYMRNQVCVYDLQLLGEMRKIQRREAYRARESVEVSVRKVVRDVEQTQEKAAKWVNTRTIDISESGMQVKFNEECSENEQLEIVIKLKNHGLNEVLPKINAKVVRCVSTGNRQFGYFLGVMFTEVPEKSRNMILKLVVLSQRSKMTYPKRTY